MCLILHKITCNDNIGLSNNTCPLPKIGLGQLSPIIPQFHNYKIVVVVPIIIVGVGRCFSTVGTCWGQGVCSVMAHNICSTACSYITCSNTCTMMLLFQFSGTDSPRCYTWGVEPSLFSFLFNFIIANGV